MSIINNTSNLQMLLEQVNMLPVPALQNKTVIPSASEKIVMSDDGYDGLYKVTVAGDDNLVEENIANGVNIFGVIGTHSGDTSMENGLIEKTLINYINTKVSKIGSYAFYGCSSLTSVNFPACKTIGSYAFYNCRTLTSVSFPACQTISVNAFYCCSSLTSLSFPTCSFINGSAFYSCTMLTSIYLMSSSICILNASHAFSKTNITSTTGFIYVPSSLVASYKTATNWTFFSNRIFSAP